MLELMNTNVVHVSFRLASLRFLDQRASHTVDPEHGISNCKFKFP
jgi:hypothetical protein